MQSRVRQCPAVLQTGFRIFFLGAAVHAAVSMIFWKMFYVVGANIFVAMPLTVWHGHEMVFGFTMAVVAGFLLTAVMNWTGVRTLNGTPLLILFLFWALARVFAYMPASFPSWPMMLCDAAFFVLLSIAVLQPLIQTKQWKQSAIFAKLLFLFGTGAVFYAALFRADLDVERKALRFAVYMLISLILTIGRRILPFFIERGVGYPVTLRNNTALDISSLVLLLAFSVIDVFCRWPVVIAVISGLLVLVHTVRLAGWYTPGIWKKSLLWILFWGYVFVILGFVFKIFAVLASRPDDAALHAFTAGGIGLFTLGMMARVAWGHTGRNIGEPPAGLTTTFSLITASAFVRVFLPIIYEPKYIFWIAVSQVLWIAAFTLYLFQYWNVLTSPRIDGKVG